MQDDPEALSELNILVGETRWQLAEIIHEVHRRMNELPGDKALDQSLMTGWLEKSQKILQIN